MPFFLRLVAAVVLAMLLILLLGPFGGAAAATGVSDKLAHVVSFGLMLWSLGVLFARVPRIGLAGVAVAVGALVEVVQGQTGRQASWGDLLADTVGVLLALGLWVAWRRGRTRQAFQAATAD